MTSEGHTYFGRINRRVRILLDGHTLADSVDGVLIVEHMFERRYYFPKQDVNMQYLVPTDYVRDDGHRGVSHWWDVQVGERLVQNGAWTYPEEPLEGRPDLRDFISFSWAAMDQMFEEDEELMVLPRSPLSRLEVFKTSRHVRVEKDGLVLAESSNLFLVQETDLPPRFYFRREDVRMDLLTLLPEKTPCPYKGGWSSYYSAQVNDKLYEYIAWSYLDPRRPEAERIAGLVAFFNEATDIYVDGKLLPKPEKPMVPPGHMADLGVDTSLRYGREVPLACGPVCGP